jgi:hypothetical protein
MVGTVQEGQTRIDRAAKRQGLVAAIMLELSCASGWRRQHGKWH